LLIAARASSQSDLYSDKHNSKFLRVGPTKSSAATFIMTITYASSHPTFVAEVSGVDFSNITPEVVADLKAGLAKVRRIQYK
jgi:hypothetical protein